MHYRVMSFGQNITLVMVNKFVKFDENIWKCDLGPYQPCFLTKQPSLEEFERQSIDKHFYENKMESHYRSQRRRFFKIWNLVAMATRGITLARNF